MKIMHVDLDTNFMFASASKKNQSQNFRCYINHEVSAIQCKAWFQHANEKKNQTCIVVMIQWQLYIKMNLEEANCLLTSPIPENPLCNVIRNKNPSLHIFLLPCAVVVGGAASGNLHIRRENVDIINL